MRRQGGYPCVVRVHVTKPQSVHGARLQVAQHVVVLGAVEWQQIQMSHQSRGVGTTRGGGHLVRMRREDTGIDCRFVPDEVRYGPGRQRGEHMAPHGAVRRPNLAATRLSIGYVDPLSEGQRDPMDGQHSSWPSHEQRKAADRGQAPAKPQRIQPNA